jgi:hypothetical protein
MKKLLLIAVFLQSALTLFSQTEYVNPPIQRQNIYSVEIKDIIGTKEEFKFAFTIENKSSDKYLVFELAKIAIAFTENDVYYPKNDEIIVVNPNSKERRTVKVVGNGNFQTDKVNIEFPRMKVNGDATDFTNTENFGTGAEQSLNIGEFATATLSGFSWKKDAWGGEMVVNTNSFDGMLLLDLNKIKGASPSNNAMPIEFKRDKLAQVALVSNDRFKSKFSIADIGSTLTNMQIAGAFKMFELRELDVPQITIKKVGYVEPVAAVDNSASLCENFTNLQGLPVKVVLFNVNGVCFKLASNGKKINENMCSNVEFDVEYGTQILTIVLNNGQTFTDKIYPAEGDSYLTFEIIQRKGEWKIQRKFDLSGDARKTTQKVDKSTVICKDYITLNNEEMNFRANLTVTRITKDQIYYIDCNTNSEKSISKMEILDIQYANGYHDKFDYPGNEGKQNMNLTRTEAEVIELRNSSKTSSSIIIGPTRH